MALKLYDTLLREEKVLEPSDGKQFRFYCCGPTVYGPAHIGNFRTFLLQDVFRRVLELEGLSPYHVRNITDVDDKTIKQSQEEGLVLKAFTNKWTQHFRKDCQKLNMLRPHQEPEATDHIPQQIEMIKRLIDRKHAYVAADGSVYFKVGSYKEYGKLSHFDFSALKTQQENPDEDATHLEDEYDKESAADFALWKAHKEEDGENGWESPWGKGRPGWHIECSAMSQYYLGDTYDLHAGGADLIFPHHENEIAQSECCTGLPFALHWFHGAHLRVEGEKMSKSLGNIYTVDAIGEKGFSPIILRYVLISAHYRQSLNFTFDGLHAAKSAMHKLERLADYLLGKADLDREDFPGFVSAPFVEGWGAFKSAWEALCEDLNTPATFGEIFTAAKALEAKDLKATEVTEALCALGKILYALGLVLFSEKEEEAPEEVVALAKQRWEAKQVKDFAAADAFREKIEALGWKVLDEAEGYALKPLE